MNNRLIVRKANDTNYIPIKYNIIEITMGNDVTTTYVVMQTIDVGWDTENNWNNWKAGKDTSVPDALLHATGRDWTGMQGTIGELTTRAIDEGGGDILVAYKPFTPSKDRH
jgi:hypothetical protein